MGLDSRNITPEFASAAVFLASDIRSFERAAVAIRRVLRQRISASTVRRLAKEVGLELAEQAGDGGDQEVVVPQAAVVSCDGGRIRTREPDGGRGVRPSGENGWRETKNASLERMTLPESLDGDDPCPDLPTTFRTAARVAKITGKPGPNADASPDGETPRVRYCGPKRVLRTVLASMACSHDFGPMIQREARRRRFFESSRRAFLGDGLPWNWTIWKQHFRSFTPILDFIHAIHYVFHAAMCLADNEADGWEAYTRSITLCWQGRVDEVIRPWAAACRDRGIDVEAKLADDSFESDRLLHFILCRCGVMGSTRRRCQSDCDCESAHTRPEHSADPRETPRRMVGPRTCPRCPHSLGQQPTVWCDRLWR